MADQIEQTNSKVARTPKTSDRQSGSTNSSRNIHNRPQSMPQLPHLVLSTDLNRGTGFVRRNSALSSYIDDLLRERGFIPPVSHSMASINSQNIRRYACTYRSNFGVPVSLTTPLPYRSALVPPSAGNDSTLDCNKEPPLQQYVTEFPSLRSPLPALPRPALRSPNAGSLLAASPHPASPPCPYPTSAGEDVDLPILSRRCVPAHK
jgi:hypothetical protein